MSPDAIIIFSAGLVPLPSGGWRSTTYEDSDAFGMLGGHDRVEAAALLSKRYPDAYLVTTSHTLGRVKPSLAEVYRDELRELGVSEERIVLEERSSTTQTAIVAALQLAGEKGWKRLLFLSSAFHLSRIEAFYKRIKSNVIITTVSSESVLIQNNPTFRKYFEEIKKSPSYEKRLTAERRGLEAIKRGKYHPAPPEDKKERQV